MLLLLLTSTSIGVVFFVDVATSLSSLAPPVSAVLAVMSSEADGFHGGGFSTGSAAEGGSSSAEVAAGLGATATAAGAGLLSGLLILRETRGDIISGRRRGVGVGWGVDDGFRYGVVAVDRRSALHRICHRPWPSANFALSVIRLSLDHGWFVLRWFRLDVDLDLIYRR